MGYNPRSDATQNRRDAAQLQRQANEAWSRHKDPKAYKELTQAAQVLEAEAKKIEQG